MREDSEWMHDEGYNVGLKVNFKIISCLFVFLDISRSCLFVDLVDIDHPISKWDLHAIYFEKATSRRQV